MPVVALQPHRRRALHAALPWLLTSLLLAMIPLAAELPVWVPLSFVGCAFWRQLIASKHWNLPAFGWRLALFIAALGGTLLGGRRLDDPATLTALLVTLISLKLLELRNARDFVLVALLGYFLVLSSFFYSQTLVQLIFAALAVLVNTVALVRCHGATGPGPKKAQARLWPTARLALGLFAQALPLTALCFFLFPRLEGRFFRGLVSSQRVTTGMSDELSPGSVARLEASDIIAFRARLLPAGNGEQLPPQALYWRGFAMGQCGGLHWARGEFERRLNAVTTPPITVIPAVARESGAAARIVQQITLVEPHGHNWLFALDQPGAAPPLGYLQYGTDDLRSRQLVQSSLVYTVESRRPPADNEASAAGTGPPQGLSPETRAAYLALPSLPPLGARTRALADGWRRESHGDERSIVRRGLEFFHTGGFTYTLNPGTYPSKRGGDALEEFLFGQRRGFCEHYAAAYATLMRAAGLPARVVVGYQGGQWNPLGGHYTVRQSDAHAWTEVWLASRGWMRFDPTAFVAPERVDFGAQSFAEWEALGGSGRNGGDGSAAAEFLARLRQPTGWRWAARQANLAWDTIEQEWDLWVVGYDAGSQQQVFQRLGINSLGQRVARQLRLGSRDSGPEWTAVLGGGAMFVSVGATLLLGTLAVRGLGWWRGRRAEEPAVRLYRRFCARAVRTAGRGKRGPEEGLAPRAATEGPLDFAARASRALPARAAEIAEITRLYVLARYGQSPDVAPLRAAVRQF